MKTVDYKDYSFNQLHELIKNLYAENERLTAERLASDNALQHLSHNLEFSPSQLSRVEYATKKGVFEAMNILAEVNKAKKKPVKKAVKKKK